MLQIFVQLLHFYFICWVSVEEGNVTTGKGKYLWLSHVFYVYYEKSLFLKFYPAAYYRARTHGL